ncbi:DUF6966 domain-containing protein [Shewanella sp. SR43-8]|uniref:DUF6966 domain-containing protein n=1 Tax=Shewanella sp. SR43-8 TaxID=2760938 RepID=UPI0015FFA706|nr:hypothetical protein [Shewanella sp. SR43-8]MBB1321407.1 hypothetical protein [Shewanella sp. SR43-8]
MFIGILANTLLCAIRVLMKTDYSDYQNILEEILELLRTYNEDHWANYFRKSLELLYKGKPQKSIAHSIGAYGGMGSFNDSLYFTGASEVVTKRGFTLSNNLYLECKLKRNIIKRALEF